MSSVSSCGDAGSDVVAPALLQAVSASAHASAAAATAGRRDTPPSSQTGDPASMAATPAAGATVTDGGKAPVTGEDPAPAEGETPTSDAGTPGADLMLALLGLGAQPPSPEWGTMLADAREFVLRAWWVVTFPGLAILITVLAFNLLGDGLRDALDPRVGRR